MAVVLTTMVDLTKDTLVEKSILLEQILSNEKYTTMYYMKWFVYSVSSSAAMYSKCLQR